MANDIEKEKIKRIKKLTNSALVGLPSIPDQTSELLRSIANFSQDGGDKKRNK